MVLIILKFICLFVGVVYFYSNTAKIIKDYPVGNAPILLMTLGIVGFLFLQFKMYL